MTDTTGAAELREAAALLREAASHATPGPWRTHDTHLNSVGGHTATVLTDRPNLTDTELIAWLPTMSHEPWDDTRNAWRNAGWMALMDPSVGLALAELLETAARFAAIHADLFTTSTGRAPTEADLDKPIGDALVVARRILGTTTGQPETEADNTLHACPGRWAGPNCRCFDDGQPEAKAPAVDRATVRDRIRRAICEAEGFAWDTDMLEPDEYGGVADSVLAVLADKAQQPTPAPAEEQRQPAPIPCTNPCIACITDESHDPAPAKETK